MNQAWVAARPLGQSEASLYMTGAVGDDIRLHHKLMVIDRQVVILGNFNYNGPGTSFDDENLVVIGDLDTTDKTADARQRWLGEAAISEIERIVDRYGVPVWSRTLQFAGTNLVTTSD